MHAWIRSVLVKEFFVKNGNQSASIIDVVKYIKSKLMTTEKDSDIAKDIIADINNGELSEFSVSSVPFKEGES